MKKMINEPVRVGCVVMIVRDGKVLLGKRGAECETAKGVFAYPGGRMDYGNTPEESAVREVLEETGLDIPEKRLVFLRYVNEFFPDQGKHYVSLVFMAESPTSDGPAINKEPTKCEGWEWYDPDNIPENVFWAVKESIELHRDKI
jgi:8-oxo-dGTP diphosphatase